MSFLSHQSRNNKQTVILSDFVKTGMPDEQLYAFILAELKKYNVTRLIGIGEKISNECAKAKTSERLTVELFYSTPDFVQP